MKMREMVIEALKAKYFGEMKEAEANIEIYLASPVGIGEHPEIIDAIDSQVGKLAEAQEKFKVLEEFSHGGQ
jgi:hypothetical protein|tara:strand:+ start:11747 stop:11962 length:216 start_codon:yes stop_codon:yes gene_type:complete